MVRMVRSLADRTFQLWFYAVILDELIMAGADPLATDKNGLTAKQVLALHASGATDLSKEENELILACRALLETAETKAQNA